MHILCEHLIFCKLLMSGTVSSNTMADLCVPKHLIHHGILIHRLILKVAHTSWYLTMYVSCSLLQVGPVADGMVKRGVSLTTVRKVCQGIAFVGPAACMVACAVLTPSVPGGATNTPLLVTLLSLGFALGAWSRAGLYCNHQVEWCGVSMLWSGVSSLWSGFLLQPVLSVSADLLFAGDAVHIGSQPCLVASWSNLHCLLQAPQHYSFCGATRPT